MAESVARREAERAAAEAELESRIKMYEAPEVQGSDVYDLEDARAVIERLRWATERIEDLDERSRIMESAAAREAAEARLRAEAAERALEDARAELAGAGTDPDHEEQRARLAAQVERAAAEAQALSGRLEALERGVTDAEEARRAAAEVASVEAQAAVERTRAELAARLKLLEEADRTPDTGHQDELLSRIGDLERASDEREAAVVREAEDLRGELTRALAQIDATRREAEEARAAVEELRSGTAEESGRLQARLSELTGDDSVARHDLDALRREHEDLRAEVRDAVRNAEEARAALERELGDAPVREAAARAAASESQVASFVDTARHAFHELHEQAAAVQVRLDEIAHETGEAARTAREASDRIDLVDRGAASVLSEVRESKVLVDELSGLAHAAREDATSGRDDAGHARAAAERAEQAAGEAREHVGRAVGEQAAGLEDVRHQLDAVRAEAEAARHAVPEGLDARIDGLREGVDGALGRLEALTHELGEARAETGEARSGLEQRLAEATGDLTAAREQAEEARHAVDGLREELCAAREDAAAARTEADAARAAAEAGERTAAELRDEVHAALAAMQDMRQGFEEARQAAISARRDAETARAAVEQAGAANADTSDRFAAVWQHMLSQAGGRPGADAAHARPVRTLVSKPKREKIPERAPRQGFDDQPGPMAVLDLKGRFTQLNPAFSKLVGYKEHEFTKAAWPSALDRGVYKEQAADLARLVAGEMEFAEIRSTYMHGQGLMVPIVGEVRLQRGTDGAPESLLLVTDPTGPAGS